MTDHDEHPSLPPWDGSILAAERDREGPSSAQQEALLARVDRSIATIGAPAAHDSELPARPPSPPSAVPLNASMALRQKLLGTALTYLVGVATGVFAHERLTRSATEAAPRAADTVSVASSDARAPTVALDVVARAAAPVEHSASAAASDAGRAAVSIAADAATMRPSVRASSRGADDLFAETNVIDMARSALARGRASAALEAIEQHQRRFARGQLAEDRESLAVEALVTLGRGDEARRRAEAFRRRWPDGVYRARVDAALALIR